MRDYVMEKEAYEFFIRETGSQRPGEIAAAILSMTNPEQMRQFFVGYCIWVANQTYPSGRGLDEVEVFCRKHVGWCFGEGMEQSQIEAWHAVTKAEHPFFGHDKTGVSLDEAFAAGCRWYDMHERGLDPWGDPYPVDGWPSREEPRR